MFGQSQYLPATRKEIKSFKQTSKQTKAEKEIKEQGLP